MKKVIINLSILLGIAVSVCGCDPEEKDEIRDCIFAWDGVTDFVFADVNFDNFTSFSNISPSDIIKINDALAVADKPVSFNINVAGRNPNNATANVEHLKWMLRLYNLQSNHEKMKEGDISYPHSIHGLTTKKIPVAIDLEDVTSFLNSIDAEGMFGFYQTIVSEVDNLIGVNFMVKPTVGGKEFSHYITLRESGITKYNVFVMPLETKKYPVFYSSPQIPTILE